MMRRKVLWMCFFAVLLGMTGYIVQGAEEPQRGAPDAREVLMMDDPPPDPQQAPTVSMAGQFPTEILDYTVGADTEGNPSIVIRMDFFNGSGEPAAFHSEIYTEALQGETRLPLTLMPDDPAYAGIFHRYRDIAPGKSIRLQIAWRLENVEDPVHLLAREYDDLQHEIRADFPIR